MEKTIHDVTTGEVTVVPYTAVEEAAFWERRTPLAWTALREDRNLRLASSDAYVLQDRWSAYSSEMQTRWSDYRQALRDLPATTSDPFNPVWPTAPE